MYNKTKLIIGSSDIMKKIIIALALLSIIICSTIGYKIVSANEKIDEIKDEIQKQTEKESYLTPYGYTMDNPNIILNPYDISPLTALILFETKEEEEITITIKGKDEKSTYQNTFQKSKQHYIPVYGLYPNQENQITISSTTTTKTYSIKTSSLPNDFIIKNTENNTNNLIFQTSNNYIYALDNNNEVRWYLTKKYTGKITRMNNGNFLLGTEIKNQKQYPNKIIEIDLLGKIYKQYNIEDGYYGSYLETDNSIFVLSKSLLEIDKQNGAILNQIKLDETYKNISEDNNQIILENETNLLSINPITKETQSQININPINTENKYLASLYITNKNYQIKKAIKFTHTTKTKESKEKILLLNYKNIDDNYQKYNISIQNTTDDLQIKGLFTNKDKVYLILDKFLDKKIYDIKNNFTTINKKGLSGKYSIYLKINNTIYKTNTYVDF